MSATLENVSRAHTKRQVIIQMNKFNMFITAVCLIFDQTTMAQEQKYLRDHFLVLLRFPVKASLVRNFSNGN